MRWWNSSMRRNSDPSAPLRYTCRPRTSVAYCSQASRLLTPIPTYPNCATPAMADSSFGSPQDAGMLAPKQHAYNGARKEQRPGVRRASVLCERMLLEKEGQVVNGVVVVDEVDLLERDLVGAVRRCQVVLHPTGVGALRAFAYLEDGEAAVHHDLVRAGAADFD